MSQSILVQDEELVLLPEKAIYRPTLRMLLVADLHLGKTNHFRKAGIAVPHQPGYETLQRLVDLITLYDAENVVILGDLFHSEKNNEWNTFLDWTRKQRVDFTVIVGNHDQLMLNTYRESDFTIYENQWYSPPFVFQHHPEDKKDNHNYYRIAGHLHPAYQLRSKARERLILPCFCVEQHQLILPAFGAFTGKERIHPKADGRYFIVAGNEVIEVPG